MANEMEVAGKALLVKLTMDTWQGTKRDRATSREVEETARAEKDVVSTVKSLVPRTMVKRMFAITRAIRRKHETMTLPWGDDGTRILPVGQYFPFEKAMDECKQEFENEVDAFVQEYEELSRPSTAKRRLGALYKPDEFPPIEWVRGRFKFRLEFMPLPLAEDIRADLSGAAEAKIEKSMADAQKQKLAKALHDAFYRLHGVLDNLHGQLSDDSQFVRPRTYEAIEDLVKVLPDMNITGDPTLTEAVRVLEANILVHSRRQLTGVAKIRVGATKDTKKLVAQLAAGMRKVAKVADIDEGVEP